MLHTFIKNWGRSRDSHSRLFSGPSEPPIRSELFSYERFAEHAHSLAVAQRVSADPRRGKYLGRRIRENADILRECHAYLIDAIHQKHSITPAAEWLVDSFYVVEEQLRDIRRDLPKGFYEELPKLSGGDLGGYPRVYGVAWAYVAHTDSRFDPEVLTHFIRSYQEIQPLTTGELWAVAITLRAVMIENLRRAAVQIVVSQNARLKADRVADELLGLAGQIVDGEATLARIGTESVPFSFLVQLLQRLRYHDPSTTPAVTWLNEKLASEKINAEEIAATVHSGQAAANLTVRNIITSFRAMTSFDWADFVESVSHVQLALTKSPNFRKMDFLTRDHYRHAVEDLAKGSSQTEIEIAERAVDWALSQNRDPGYFLFSEGRPRFEADIKFSCSSFARLIRILMRYPTFFYLSSIVLLTLVFVLVPALIDAKLPGLLLLILAVLAIAPASDAAVSLINRLVTELIGPKRLPKFELENGPDESTRTFVVVPTFLSHVDEISQQIERLEVHYLSNPEGEVRFALLTDWKDALTECTAKDAEELDAAVQAIAALNAKHGLNSDAGSRFFIFHRKRLWNPCERRWMGWERKRGKLHEFNRLLRGALDTSFVQGAGFESPPQSVRYVITLDADTKLPKGSVSQLVGAISHPLHIARFDPQLGKVAEGYGILQPRVTASLPTRAERSIFQRLFSGECGIDPYASAVSDVYQDLFGEGSFTGKGIYDVDAFERSLEGRIPENALLSHDLFEGSFARSGYVSDVEFFEDFPSNVEVSSARNHRWIRGDWQLLPWIFGKAGRSLSVISRWKMLDNLRRSLSPVGITALIIVAFCSPRVHAALWIFFALAGLALPAMLSFACELIPRNGRMTLMDHARENLRKLRMGLGHFAVNIILIAHHSWLHLDAIFRALWRLFVSRRNLLEWVTAAQAKEASSMDLRSFFWRMKGSFVIGAGTAVLVSVNHPAAFFWVSPIVFAWCLAAVFGRWISLPSLSEEVLPLNAGDELEMRLYSRRIWRFFTTFVQAEDHFLPPDNFQEDPEPVVAHRSSPTNFGLYLLSTVAAYDFGWSGLVDMTDRLEATLTSMQALPQFKGHFYNWYETRDFRVLDPQYISSVDSGNLAGHLLALSQACLELQEKPIFSTTAGTEDSLILLRRALRAQPDDRRSSTVSLGHLEEGLDQLAKLLSHPPHSITEAVKYWDALVFRGETLVDIARAYGDERGEQDTNEILAWADLLMSDIESRSRDFRLLAPWASSLAQLTQIFESVAVTSEVKGHGEAIAQLLSFDVTLHDLATRCFKAIEHLEAVRDRGATYSTEHRIFFDQFIDQLTSSQVACSELARRLTVIYNLARAITDKMDFSFLFNQKKKLFSIGYRVVEGQLDESCYDLLASEARLTSYVAIIKGDVPVSHWFRLGRALTPLDTGAALISWSGSMFEYLMPSLVMNTPRGSLLDQTCKLVVKRQIQYGNFRGVPWGISESAYNVRDLDLTYQYSNFGVPGLGLKRGLSNDLVIAPYASALAAMYDPRAALKNLARIETLHGGSRFGFYESMDFTPLRLRERQEAAVVRAYMAHHQGMALISFANVIHGGLMRRRFHANPLVQAAELLLQERTPRSLGSVRYRLKEPEVIQVREDMHPMIRKLSSPHHFIPSSHLLSNGRYAVMVTAAGSGYSRWKNIAVTRWREDVTRDNSGNYIYVRDTASGKFWSPTFQPACREADHSEIIFSEDQAKFLRKDGTLLSTLEVIVSAEDDAELRRLSITNQGSEVRELEITSYAEAVLAPSDSDRAHPAFSNLFVQTEYLRDVGALIATRRPRSAKDEPAFIAQVLSTDAETFGGVEYETDRVRFIGRGRTLRRPISIIDGRPLSNTVGAVLDPVLSLRTRVRIAPGVTARICFTTIAASSRAEIVMRAEKYRNPSVYERASTLAWTHAQAKLHHLGIDTDEAQVFQRLANRVIFSDPLMRPTSEVLKQNVLNVTGLWGRGISGDLPIILVRIDDPEDQGLVKQLLRAHEYWRMKRLAVDIVILNEKASSYAQDLQVSLEGLARGSEAATGANGDHALGRIFVLRNDLLDPREKSLLLSVARAVLNSRQGTLSEQVMRSKKIDVTQVLVQKERLENDSLPAVSRGAALDSHRLVAPELEFFNGIGGFSEDGREYTMILGKGQRTPAPWINVISNPEFGFQVSESGSGYTWAVNSRENQLTGWSNDPVVDPSSEAFYLSDRVTGRVWSPTASPIRLEETTYISRHGMGYSTFEHTFDGIQSSLTQFVSLTDPIKTSSLTLENHSALERVLSVTAYVEWVLGFSRAESAAHIVTEIDEKTGALFAYNTMNSEFGKRICFIDFGGKKSTYTADRSEFIGRNRNLDNPLALEPKKQLRGTVGAGLDPCGALQVEVKIAAGARAELKFYLGQADSREAARELIKKHRGLDAVHELKLVTDDWSRFLVKVQVSTPDRAMDLLLNGWLLYQTRACRFWARAAFYQAGGAFGFRDQLQDVMSMVNSDPEATRAHILKASARQFTEGDVQHWWHPPSGRGVRTHFSDDLLWLPYVVSHYLDVTGDQLILDEIVSFLEGPVLRPDQEDSYFTPAVAAEANSASLYEHCARTVERSLATGSHGLPLIGSGDWNDGMNRVGNEGKGESVWVAWFLHSVLSSMIPLARRRGEEKRALLWAEHLIHLKTAIETHAWDGAWYRRAYFDDGTPLGSSVNAECRIDSITQSWAILSGAGDPVRAAQAMESVERNLIRADDELVLLFSPPFDQTSVDPGYIKGYLPGVRENGGQYTHAAVWCVCAYAKMGRGTRAMELFSMLNPIHHASTRTGVNTYKVEPYVMAADIYGEPPHVGRGGWTWYTGSSGWMYRSGLEFILGIKKQGQVLVVDPSIPHDWDDFEAIYRHGKSTYHIRVENPEHVSNGIRRLELDGASQPLVDGPKFELSEDGREHRVRLVMGTAR
jgi:cyclic beta-1,2-glucan synthetase